MKRARVVALAGCLSACASRPATDPTAPYPCTLHLPSELGPDFWVEQHVEATAKGRTGSFDGVLQKRGSDLVLVGLGPGGVRAFVLRQRGSAITFEQSMGPALPFPPRNVFVDVHRAFFKRLVPPPSGSGTVRGHLDDEEVEEDWREGHLRERRFSRANSPYRGLVRIVFGRGCTADRCAPESFRLVNEWFSYSLVVTNRPFTWL